MTNDSRQSRKNRPTPGKTCAIQAFAHTRVRVLPDKAENAKNA
jgi:hypothetical protein